MFYNILCIEVFMSPFNSLHELQSTFEPSTKKIKTSRGSLYAHWNGVKVESEMKEEATSAAPNRRVLGSIENLSILQLAVDVANKAEAQNHPCTSLETSAHKFNYNENEKEIVKMFKATVFPEELTSQTDHEVEDIYFGRIPAQALPVYEGFIKTFPEHEEYLKDANLFLSSLEKACDYLNMIFSDIIVLCEKKQYEKAGGILKIYTDYVNNIAVLFDHHADQPGFVEKFDDLINGSIQGRLVEFIGGEPFTKSDQTPNDKAGWKQFVKQLGFINQASNASITHWDIKFIEFVRNFLERNNF